MSFFEYSILIEVLQNLLMLARTMYRYIFIHKIENLEILVHKP